MRATIFVTDDEPAIRSAMVKRLSRRQHTVTGFESGDALLKGLDREMPDLILLDLKMPGLSGLETLKAIRSEVSSGVRHHADGLWNRRGCGRSDEARRL